jgi:hypothetical protein
MSTTYSNATPFRTNPDTAGRTRMVRNSFREGALFRDNAAGKVGL